MEKKFKSYILIIVIVNFSINLSAQIDDIRTIDSLNYYLEKGDNSIKSAQYRAALGYYKAALLIKDTVTVKNRMVQAYELNGLYKEAIALQSSITINDKFNEKQLFKLASLHKKIGELTQAYKVYKILNVLNKSNPNYIYEMAVLTKSLQEQKKLFQEAFKQDSLHLKTIVKLAAIYHKTNMIDSAQYYTDKGLKISPKHSGLKLIKAKLLYKQEKFQESYDLFFDLLKSDQDNIETNLYLGILCIQMEKLDKAEYYLDRAYQLNPRIPDTNYYLGLLYQKFNDFDKSNSYFNQSILLKTPDTTRDYYQLGLNAQKLKQPQQALDYFKLSYENDSTNSLALYEIAIMTDLLYEDKQMALNFYKLYLDKFKSNNKVYSEYVQKRINEIRQMEFFNN